VRLVLGGLASSLFALELLREVLRVRVRACERRLRLLQLRFHRIAGCFELRVRACLLFGFLAVFVGDRPQLAQRLHSLVEQLHRLLAGVLLYACFGFRVLTRPPFGLELEPDLRNGFMGSHERALRRVELRFEELRLLFGVQTLVLAPVGTRADEVVHLTEVLADHLGRSGRAILRGRNDGECVHGGGPGMRERTVTSPFADRYALCHSGARSRWTEARITRSAARRREATAWESRQICVTNFVTR
jgi:hypothetical protein